MGANRLIRGISLLLSLKAPRGSINEKHTMLAIPAQCTCSRCNGAVIDKIQSQRFLKRCVLEDAFADRSHSDVLWRTEV